MTDKDISRIIIRGVDALPVPWERLWSIFQRVLQLVQKDAQYGNREKLEKQDKNHVD